ncbi:MAG: RIP metalloprotease, partial [Proteobacteria bacterium]|nr:RIP metalloprotease [Pseudomonadota bacterium]
PLGGYVKFTDDADVMSTSPREPIEDPEELARARAKGLFHAQPLLKRAAVVAAGPLTNFIFSIFAFAVIALFLGRDATDITRIPARIAVVQAHSAAAAAGLREGDVILSADGRATPNFPSLQGVVAQAAGRAIALRVQRGSQTLSLVATPTPRASGDDQGHRAGQGMLGVIGPLPLQSERVIVHYNPIEAVAVGAQRTWDMVAQTGVYIFDVFRGRASANQIAGPTGIFMVSGQVATSALEAPANNLGGRVGLLALSLLSLAAILSVAVGIVNLLPIPILDGGHLLFYVIEALRGGRPLPAAAQEWAYRAGFAVMASLFLFATWNDISRLLPGMR